MPHQPLAIHPTDWSPNDSELKVTLNVSLDACIVPSEADGARLDVGHVVCLDNLFGEPEREELLNFITEEGRCQIILYFWNQFLVVKPVHTCRLGATTKRGSATYFLTSNTHLLHPDALRG